jgi:hypothetical protein
MRRLLTIAALVAVTALQAQTLNITNGSVTYQYPAAQTGEMTFTNGSQLTILGKTYNLSDITAINTNDATVKDNKVSVVYNGTEALVNVSGNVAQYVAVTVNGAHVTIEQDSQVDDTVGEITYSLSGTSTDGELTLGGSYKATVELNGLTLTNPNGAALNITNGKRIKVSAKNETENTLTDGANGSQKAALYCKGHLELQGKGTLTVYGNTAHAIKSGDYTQVKNLTLNIAKAVKDGINANEYFLMESGMVTISGVGDDGIQADLDGSDSTGETTDHEDEDSGNIYIMGGTLNVSITASAAKGLKASGDLTVADGTVTVTTTGNGTYDSSEADAKGCAALKSDGNMTISGGTLALKSSGTGGKCIKADGKLNITGGNISATTTGAQYSYSRNYTASPKAIKSDGAMTISGGTISASSEYHEGIETKSTLDITGGTVSVTAKDDAINSASHMTVSGGMVMGYSTGNDGLDANGNMYIKGGLVYAICSGSPEVALDANTEGGYKLYVSGGTIMAIGGLENGASLTQTCYQSSSWSKNTWYAITVGNDTFAFKTPSSGGSGLVVSGASQPTLKSSVTVTGGTECFDGMGNTGGTISNGSTVSLSTYSGGNSGPGGGGPGGGGPGGGGGWW